MPIFFKDLYFDWLIGKRKKGKKKVALLRHLQLINMKQKVDFCSQLWELCCGRHMCVCEREREILIVNVMLLLRP
jgi:hypothetical protein